MKRPRIITLTQDWQLVPPGWGVPVDADLRMDMSPQGDDRLWARLLPNAAPPDAPADAPNAPDAWPLSPFSSLSRTGGNQ